MERRDRLQELLLALEGALDQTGRAQRHAIAGDVGIEGVNERIDAALVELASLRNAIRDALMSEMARSPRPKKLPTVD